VLIRVSASSGVPIYLQIESQMKHAITAGAVHPGDSVPSIRKLASQLRVNPNTVARAYQNLERDGIIRMVPGGGTFVADNVPGLLKAEKIRRLRPIAMQLAVEAMQMRLDRDEIFKLLDNVMKELGVVV
jgi:GntR family transcriptional regulator